MEPTNLHTNTAREDFIHYIQRAYADPRVVDDVLNRYDSNYNGMRDHWDRALLIILGRKEIPLNERRGQ